MGKKGKNHVHVQGWFNNTNDVDKGVLDVIHKLMDTYNLSYRGVIAFMANIMTEVYPDLGEIPAPMTEAGFQNKTIQLMTQLQTLMSQFSSGDFPIVESREHVEPAQMIDRNLTELQRSIGSRYNAITYDDLGDDFDDDFDD